MDEKKEVEFEFKVESRRYNSPNFKIYVVSIDTKKYKDIKPNSKGEFIITGDVQDLSFDVKYLAKAIVEVNKNFGLQYAIKNIKRNKPTDLESSRAFLSEILTENQTNTLLSVYPDIIDRIMKEEEVDLNKLNGIKDFTFNKIKTKVIENFVLIELVEKYSGVLSFQVMKKLYNEYTSVELVEKALTENPYSCLTELNRIGFKIADKLILELEEKGKIKLSEGTVINSKFRMKSSMDYVLQENESSGSTKMKISKLRTECEKLTPQCMKYFLDILKKFQNVEFYLDQEDKTVSIYNTYLTESYIGMIVKNMLINSFSYNINTELYRTYNGITLTDEQMGCLNNVDKYNISILTAPAGAGKSQAMSNLIHMLEENNKTYMMCTPTGKSAEVLAQFTSRDVGTIHRQLGYNPAEGWGYGEGNKLNTDVVIVDETSMADIWLMKHLLEAIDVSRTKLLLVFDAYQLPSVAAGNVAHDLLTSEYIPTTLLTKIFRYNEGGLMQVATQIRKSEEFLDNKFNGKKVFGTKKDFIYIELLQTKIRQQVAQIYMKLLNDGYDLEDIMIVTSQNKGDYGTKEINKFIQYLLQKDKNNNFITKGDVKFYKGDKVVQTVNNYKAIDINGEVQEIYNGNTGIVAEIKYNELIVDFGDGKLLVYNKDLLEQLDLAYCTTIHKSQGSSSKQVIVIAPKAHTFMLNSNLLYVAATRAKERVWCIGNIITINRAIKKKENLSRETHLTRILDKIIKKKN